MTDKNFLGIPIEGSINVSSSKKQQEDPRILQAKMATLVSHPGFEAMRWRQYTPYFNDGDPCVFRIYEVYFRFVGMSPITEDEEGAYEEEDGFYTVNNGRYTEADSPEQRVLGVSKSYSLGDGWDREPEDLPLIELASEVASMITRGAHWDFLYSTFGDHAVVTVYSDKILVDEYDHD